MADETGGRRDQAGREHPAAAAEGGAIALYRPLLFSIAYRMTGSALADSLSLAFLVLLERLTPVERAVFLLHDVFAYPFDEVARIVGKSAATCRQIAGRARRRVREWRPRFAPSPAEHAELTRRFARACADGDLDGLLALLADDATAWADGGGKVTAARRPIRGATNVARYMLGVVTKAPVDVVSRVRAINGQPGLVVAAGEGIVAVIALEIADGRVTAIRSVVNPDKLRGLATRWA